MIERLLGDLPVADFLDRYYFRLPYSRAGGAPEAAELAGWATVETLLARKNVDCFLAKERERWEGPTPGFAQARELFGQGYTIVLRDTQEHIPALARLAEEFRAALSAPVNVHVYATPAGTSGFGWHYDVEDVFILQAQGRKTYTLRKNTVHPWPVLESMPGDLKYEREVMPFWSCTLAPGDWLYIPPGWWHEARAETDSITLAVGLLSPTALDLVDFVRKRLPLDVAWRQRLPLSDEALRAALAGLGREFARILSDPALVREFRRENPPKPTGNV